MTFDVLAADYDGTLARDGAVDPATRSALERIRAAGVRTILVTGRRLDSLQRVLAPLSLFDRVVAENGAVLHDPATGAARSIAPPPDAGLMSALQARGVSPLHVGESIVATLAPMEGIVREVLGQRGLDLRIVHNKGAVMILPPSIDKAVGLGAALRELGRSFEGAVAVGDAENDMPFLSVCGCSAAVANALPAVKAVVDIELAATHGEGVVELIGRLWPMAVPAGDPDARRLPDAAPD